MQKILAAITRPFRRKSDTSCVLVPDSTFWRLPEAGPLKLQRIEETWGKGTVPMVLIYDLTPLGCISFDDTVQLAEQLFGGPKYSASNITYRTSTSSEKSVTYLIVRYAKFLLPELTVQGRQIPLLKASHRLSGRYSGSVLEFENLCPNPHQTSLKAG